MITWLCAAAALAADPTDPPTAPAELFWAGEWGLDPSRSDDPSSAVQQAFQVPIATTSTTSRQLAPDGGQSDSEDDRSKALHETLALLGRSGRCGFHPAADGPVSVDWGDGHPLQIPDGSKWQKVTPEDGDRYRIRLRSSPEVLVVERRYKTSTLTESWLPPTEPGSTERVVVVQLEGPTLADGVEFRRVYRRLD